MRALAVGSRARFLAMSQAITANRLRHVVDRAFPLDEAFGKVVISHA
ncbi:hypothetical protein [Nonomuraea sediminis]|nr:hypothetical protein [Nonomuraea sediminis]